MAINGVGGSGINVSQIVSQLMSVESQPLNKLSTQESGFNQKISAIGMLQSKLDSFFSSASAFSESAGGFSVSGAGNLGVSRVGSGAMVESLYGAHSISVGKLSSAQVLVANPVADKTAAIGVGVITIDAGQISGGSFDSVSGKYTGAGFVANGASFSITVDSTNNSLQGIAAEINKSGKANANIIYDGANYHLSLSSMGGQASSLRLAVSGDPTLTSLLGHDSSATQGLREVKTAQDATVTLDGVTLNSSSNTFEGNLEDIKLDISKLAVGDSVSFNIEKNMTKNVELVNNFVKAFNDVKKYINGLTVTQQGGGKAQFSGDVSLNSLLRSLESTLKTASGGKTIADMGVSFQKDGMLKLDEAKLNSFLSVSGNVGLFFGTTNSFTSALSSISISLDSNLSAKENSLQSMLSTLNQRKEVLQHRLSTKEQHYIRMYSALDKQLSGMNEMASFLGNIK